MPETTTKRIAVIGAGAVGAYFGGRLAEAGIEVTFIARGETLRALRHNGLRVDSSRGDIRLTSVDATDTPADVGPVDTIIVAVKAWQVPEVAEAIQPLVGAQTLILPLQNGVEATGQLTAVHGEERVLSGTCRIIALQTAPGCVRHAGAEPLIAVGEQDNRPTDGVAALVETLRASGVAVHTPPDIHASIWKKFLFIAPVSGIGAVTRASFGVMRTTSETRALIVQAMQEVRAVAMAKGIALPDDAIDKALVSLDEMPAEATSSMQRDVMTGRPSELESNNGAVVRLGRAADVATPVHEFIYGSLLPLETTARRAEGPRHGPEDHDP